MTDAPLVSYEDVEALRVVLRPGETVLSRLLYPRYVAVMKAAGKAPASQVALGRALARAGWGSKLVRKSKGSRGKQRQTGFRAWTVPGARPFTQQDERMAIALRATLDYRTAPFIPSTLIQSTYESMARRHGWRDTMRQSQVTRWLNEHGFPEMRHGGQKGVPGAIGQPHRFVELSRIDMLVPPAAPTGT